jgi:hypothetical protein
LCPKNLALAGKFDQITTIAENFLEAIEKARSN